MSAIDRIGGWPQLLSTLLRGEDLSADDAQVAMNTVLLGEASSAQIAAFMMALRSKGETADELQGMLAAVLEASEPVPLDVKFSAHAIDIVGTGGDKSHSVNISTMAAFVVAGAGVPVCKHGNRAASSQCGTADVLEALGIKIDLDGAAVARCVEQTGMGFCFAPKFHPAFRYAGPTRKELGVPTAFNLLGPMANPAQVSYMVVGVGDPSMAHKMAHAIAGRGVQRAWVVHGHGGLDELSLSGDCPVVEIHQGEISEFMLNAKDFGLEPADVTAVRGGDPVHNAQVIRDTFNGTRGAVRDIVVFNAAAGLVVAGVSSHMGDGIERAQASIDSGAANGVVDALIAISNVAAE
ncbi:MAG: anthranilate phosphoribosyltransferase [Ilumatobacteraceae bacterium]|jgi:anthranilate phosphoribosyltransferase|nr:MAG: anthranilate phosphoribosyltransferase [Acidimicrobiia bacterium BACL6 MAG-120910-bin40]HAG66825.1 anthranilate phosphoribosyltransferase [Acidimicrobium sp.]